MKPFLKAFLAFVRLKWLPLDAASFSSLSLYAALRGSHREPPVAKEPPGSLIVAGPALRWDLESSNSPSRRFELPKNWDGSRTGTILVCRLIGNIAFPLQDPLQHDKNVKIIHQWLPDGLYTGHYTGDRLKFDQYVAEAATGFNHAWKRGTPAPPASSIQLRIRNLFVLNQLYNVTLERSLEDTFNRLGLLYYQVPLERQMLHGRSHGPRTTEFRDPTLHTLRWTGANDPILYMAGPNRGRNLMMELSMAVESDLLLGLDGGVALTRESLALLAESSRKADSGLAPILVRVNEFGSHGRPWDLAGSGDGPVENILKHSLFGEPQLVYKRSANDVFYSTTAKYGNRDKVGKLLETRETGKCNGKLGSRVVLSLNAANKEALQYSRECGYLIRLPYWRTPEADDVILDLASRLLERNFDMSTGHFWFRHRVREGASKRRLWVYLYPKKVASRQAQLANRARVSALLKRFQRLSRHQLNFEQEYRSLARDMARKYFGRMLLSGHGVDRWQLLTWLQHDSM